MVFLAKISKDYVQKFAFKRKIKSQKYKISMTSFLNIKHGKYIQVDFQAPMYFFNLIILNYNTLGVSTLC